MNNLVEEDAQRMQFAEEGRMNDRRKRPIHFTEIFISQLKFSNYCIPHLTQISKNNMLYIQPARLILDCITCLNLNLTDYKHLAESFNIQIAIAFTPSRVLYICQLKFMAILILKNMIIKNTFMTIYLIACMYTLQHFA